MSNLIVPDVAKIPFMKRAVAVAGYGFAVPTKLRLLKASITVNNALTRATCISNEADFSGYPAGGSSLTSAAVAASLDGSGRSVASWAALTFTKSGATGNTIYGYWVDDNTAGTPELLWAEIFDSPVVLTTDGTFLILVPQFTGKSQFLNT